MTERQSYDALVVGGGLAGLSMTARLAAAGRRVLCVDAGPYPAEDDETDPRTTAILMPGVETLRRAGAAEAIESLMQPLYGMRIVDCGGAQPVPRGEACFDADEIGKGLFGWNIPNAPVRHALAQVIDGSETGTFRPATLLSRWTAREDTVVAHLSDGETVTASLLIAADGRGSRIRAQAGLGVRRWSYPQTITAARVVHERPHGGVSVEMHHVGGPLTFAPLQGQTAGLVWMNSAEDAARIEALDDKAFLALLNEKSNRMMGEVTAVSRRRQIPASTLCATGVTARRVALIGETAHAFPPIGAQGLNLSLRDVETLAMLIEDKADIGAEPVLRSYARKRMPDILTRVAGVDVLNRSVLTRNRPLRDLRAAALGTIGRVAPLRKFAMRVGMGG